MSGRTHLLLVLLLLASICFFVTSSILLLPSLNVPTDTTTVIMDPAVVVNLFNAMNMGLVGNSQIDPAVFAALLGITQSLQAVQIVPGGLQSLASPQQDLNLGSLQSKLSNAAAQIREIQDSLRPIVSQTGRDVIDKLEVAMTKLYKLAVFIRGDYDDREPDTTHRDELLKQAVHAFKEVKDCAEAGLNKISRLHSQVMEIENMVINPAKQDVAALLESNENEVKNLQDQIQNSETSVNTLEHSVWQQSQAVSSLHDRISSTRDAKLASDIAVSTIFPQTGFLSLLAHHFAPFLPLS